MLKCGGEGCQLKQHQYKQYPSCLLRGVEVSWSRLAVRKSTREVNPAKLPKPDSMIKLGKATLRRGREAPAQVSKLCAVENDWGFPCP